MSLLAREDLAKRDASDPLAQFRERFALPEGVVYLDGNSLGALPRAAGERLREVVERQWGESLIRGWNEHDWIGLPQRAGDKIARLIGASPGEVVAGDSTSVNLFKLLASALALRPDRGAILTEAGNFPTDGYIIEGLLGVMGRPRNSIRYWDTGETKDVIAAIDSDTAVVVLTHVNYKSGRIHDMEAITKAAHQAGALMLWDLCHSAGALPVELNACNVDFAVGCGYKYLNGGPGAPAFLYVAERLQNDITPPLSGWHGHAAPFAFERDYRPAPGIARNLCGTPPVLSMACLDAALDLMLEADMDELRRKSLALSNAFIALVEQECGNFSFQIIAPPAAERGSQVSLAHQHGYPIVQALIARGVIGDFREPNILRFGFAPLYLRHLDIWNAVAALKKIMETSAWDKAEFHAKGKVT
ncbi:MAG: kynureninase [Alphaproteobacteria bacterium]